MALTLQRPGNSRAARGRASLPLRASSRRAGRWSLNPLSRSSGPVSLRPTVLRLAQIRQHLAVTDPEEVSGLRHHAALSPQADGSLTVFS
jgi:hypothetical protein